MPFITGTTDIGPDTVPLCGVPGTGVKVKNLGGSVVYLGGPDVTADGESAGYPLAAGEAGEFTGTGEQKESPVVPAPPAAGSEVLYARTADGAGISRVAFIAIG